MDDLELLEPRKIYNNYLKDLHNENVCEYFDKLTKTSKIDEEENKVTAKRYEAKLAIINKLEKSLSGKKGLKGFLIFLTVVSFLAGIVGIFLGINVDSIYFLLLIGFLLGGLFIFLIVKTNKAIKEFDSQIAKEKTAASDLLKQCLEQLYPLKALFNNEISLSLFSKTLPQVKMDRNLDVKTLAVMKETFGLTDNLNKDSSTLAVQSGTLFNNPFLMTQNLTKCIINQSYSGTLTISWTVRVKTQNGWTTQVRTQVLHATVSKPKPIFNIGNELIYCSDAAPKSSFSRIPGNMSTLNEKQRNKEIEKFEKQATKKENKALKNGNNFTLLANKEFECCFNALNRDNEVEFRMLFSPLAQRAMVDLIENPDPYGDDFYFRKDKCLNHISTSHNQGRDISGIFESGAIYSYETLKEKFISYNNDYFKRLYFDFAPLLAIPLYQENTNCFAGAAPKVKNNVSSYEIEAAANAYNQSYFKPENCDTDVILKCELIKSSGCIDYINVNAYGYEAIDRIDYVPTLGGDGKMHPVPVPWVEYIPVEKQTSLAVAKLDADLNTFASQKEPITNILNKYADSNTMIFSRGILSFFNNDNYDFNGKEIEKLFAKKED